MKTVKEVSKLTGVSVRALHHYDTIGLLKPTKVTQAGYRLYDDEAVEKLYLILVFRELGFSLKEIADIAFKDIEYDVFDENDVEYRCTCSRERMLHAVASLGEKDVRKLLDEQEAEGKPRELEVTCRFCNGAYIFDEAELLEECAKRNNN
jgi:DNA-binding transcriptional MerR regulator